MHASSTTHQDGSVALYLDGEAARAVFASVLFAARFHEGLTPLVPIAKQALMEEAKLATEGSTPCQ